MNFIYTTTYPWKLMTLWIAATDAGLCRLSFERAHSYDSFISAWPPQQVKQEQNAVLDQVIHSLDNYFSGHLEPFDVPIDLLSGTPFQQSVWAIVRRIPFGRTRTYGQIAQELGTAARFEPSARQTAPIRFPSSSPVIAWCGTMANWAATPADWILKTPCCVWKESLFDLRR
jgi:O6-methylguanine-DNA--protein-cysteine methyltransferase